MNLYKIKLNDDSCCYSIGENKYEALGRCDIGGCVDYTRISLICEIEEIKGIEEYSKVKSENLRELLVAIIESILDE